MTEIIAAIAGILGTIIVSVFTYFMARRAGIGPYQDTLVSKLKDLVELQSGEISTLKTQNGVLLSEVTDLKKRVDELEALTVEQALLISRLTIVRTRRKSTSPKIQTQESDL
jgi:hypothetical protein